MRVNSSVILVLGMCTLVGCSVPPRTIDARTNPPIPANYNWKKYVASWMKSFFVEAPSLRSVMISDLVAIDDPSGVTWLVCVELDARARGGDYMGPRRFALGFLTSEPTTEEKALNRKATTWVQFLPGSVPDYECDRYPRSWTPWPEWERALNADDTKKHGREKSTSILALQKLWGGGEA
jgi:hypothetical protein